MEEFIQITVFAAVAVAFVFFNLFISRMIAPRKPGAAKNSAYECGEEAIGQAWVNYGVRFQNYALAFIFFDIELALVFPVGRIFRESIGSESVQAVAASLIAFLLILFLGLIYIWRAGDLSWSHADGKGEGLK
jgi:NADH-quinone oxidoreductase subunit A